MNSGSKKPIPYASVFCKQKHTGGYADENGSYNLSSNIMFGDTLFISSVGYKSKFFLHKKGVSEFQLNIAETTLDEVKISPIGNEIVLGSLKKESRFTVDLNQYKARSELCLFMPNTKKRSGKILSVSYYISSDSKPKTPFRVRIYSAKNKEPKNDLLVENLVEAGKRAGGWVEIDVAKYNIPFDDEGVFIGMESLYGLKKSSFYTITNINTNKREVRYGQAMGLTDEFDSAIAYQRQFNADWTPYAQKFPAYVSKKIFYPMIRIKIKSDE